MRLTKSESRTDRSLVSTGMTAAQLVIALPEIFPTCRTFTFLTYEPTPGLEERIAKKGRSLHSVFKAAAQLRRFSGGRLPYWESVLTTAWSTRGFDILL